MKQYGFTGKGTGKLGSSVFAISGGEQIVRQYNPIVSNPQTEAQTAQRAKFKLLTQLAAAMSGQIAFRKSGLTSVRNKFVSANIGVASYAGGKAEVDLEKLKITSGFGVIPEIHLATPVGAAPTIKLEAAASADIDNVVYCVYAANEDGKLSFIKEVTSSTPGANRDFEVTLPVDSFANFTDAYVLAYGIKNVSEAGKVKLENYIMSENSVSGLLGGVVNVIRSLSISDYSLTETSGMHQEL